MPRGVRKQTHTTNDEPAKHGSAKITWLGEDELHGDGAGPSKNTWNGIVFPKGVPVAVSNPHMIAKAKTNPFYSVEMAAAKDEPEPEAETE